MKRCTKERMEEIHRYVGTNPLSRSLAHLVEYPCVVLQMENEASKTEKALTESVYLPTGGVFAEGLLGRANTAEYLNLERYFNWQDSPIPHQAPPISDEMLVTRAQGQSLEPTGPGSNLNIVNTPQFPDPTGLQSVLAAIQNPNMFRDMSNSGALVNTLSGLMNLAGQMGTAASQMTGQAAANALNSATQIGQTAAAMAQQMFAQSMSQAGAAFGQTMTSQGAGLNAVKNEIPPGSDQQRAVQEILGVPPDTVVTDPVAAASGPATQPQPEAATAPDAPAQPQAVPTPQGNPNLLPSAGLADITGPGQVTGPNVQPSPARQQARDRVDQLIQGSVDPPDQAALAQIGLDSFDESVLPRLKQASNDDRLLAPALDEWLEWIGSMAQLGVDGTNFSGPPSLADAEAEASFWVVGGLHNAVLQAQQRAIASNHLAFLDDALHWSSQATMLGVATDANRLEIGHVIEDFPFAVEVFNVSYPQTVAVGETHALTATAALKLGDNPHLFQPSLDWQIEVDSGNTVGFGAGTTNQQGGLATVVERTAAASFQIRIIAHFKLGGVPVRPAIQVLDFPDV